MKCLSLLSLLFVAACLSGCASLHQPKVKRYQGYWTVGEAFSYFTLIDRSKSYGIFNDDMPSLPSGFFEKQPRHPDPFHMNGGDCQAVYLEVIGTPYYYKAWKVTDLHVSKILKVGPAPKEFFTTGKHPMA